MLHLASRVLFSVAFWFLIALPSYAETKVRIALPFSGAIAENFAENFANIISSQSDGELVGEVHGNGTLGKADDLYNGVSIGIIDVALLPARRPFYSTGLSAPFTFSSFDSAKPFFEAFESTANDRAIALAVFPTDVAVLVSDMPVEPQNISGINILTRRPDLAEEFDFFERREEPLSEILKRGVGQGNAAEGLLFRLTGPQADASITRLDHRFVADVVLVSRAFFEELQPDLQQIIIDAALQASNEALSGFETLLWENFERLQELGWNISDQTPVAYLSPDFTSGGDDCTADEYRKDYDGSCRCERGDDDDEC